MTHCHANTKTAPTGTYSVGGCSRKKRYGVTFAIKCPRTIQPIPVITLDKAICGHNWSHTIFCVQLMAYTTHSVEPTAHTTLSVQPMAYTTLCGTHDPHNPPCTTHVPWKPTPQGSRISVVVFCSKYLFPSQGKNHHGIILHCHSVQDWQYLNQNALHIERHIASDSWWQTLLYCFTSYWAQFNSDQQQAAKPFQARLDLWPNTCMAPTSEEYFWNQPLQVGAYLWSLYMSVVYKK